MPPFGFNAPITEGFVAFAIPTLDKLSFHIQRSELTSSMDYKHTKIQQLTNAPTHQLKISSTHQLKNINPQTQNINPRTQKTSTHKLKNSSTQKLKKSSTPKIRSSSTHKLINPSTQKLKKSSTQKLKKSSTKKNHKLINPQTQKLKNLNYYFFILQQRSIFRAILAKIWGKK